MWRLYGPIFKGAGLPQIIWRSTETFRLLYMSEKNVHWIIKSCKMFQNSQQFEGNIGEGCQEMG